MRLFLSWWHINLDHSLQAKLTRYSVLVSDGCRPGEGGGGVPMVMSAARNDQRRRVRAHSTGIERNASFSPEQVAFLGHDG